jgi:hypothetical protein
VVPKQQLAQALAPAFAQLAARVQVRARQVQVRLAQLA